MADGTWWALGAVAAVGAASWIGGRGSQSKVKQEYPVGTLLVLIKGDGAQLMVVTESPDTIARFGDVARSLNSVAFLANNSGPLADWMAYDNPDRIEVIYRGKGRLLGQQQTMKHFDNWRANR